MAHMIAFGVDTKGGPLLEVLAIRSYSWSYKYLWPCLGYLHPLHRTANELWHAGVHVGGPPRTSGAGALSFNAQRTTASAQVRAEHRTVARYPHACSGQVDGRLFHTGVLRTLFITVVS